MTTETNNGGQAFPSSDQYTPDGQPIMQGSSGMSLRDWFAGQALAGMGTWMPDHGAPVLSAKRAMDARALWAYEQADAMLAARKKDGAS